MEPVTDLHIFENSQVLFGRKMQIAAVFSKLCSYHNRTIIAFSTERYEVSIYDPIQHHMLIIRDYPIQHRPANI